MSDEADEVIESIGKELVSRIAPEELPLYPSLANQFLRARGGRRRNASSDDQILGFGAGEAVTLITPVILMFSRGFWEALMAETAKPAVNGLLQQVKVHLSGRRAVPELTPFTTDQIQLVRAVAEKEASRLNVSKRQAGLLADAMVGALVAPPPVS